MLYLRMITKQLVKNLSIALALSIVMVLFLVGGRALAAAPGCYVRSLGSTASQLTTTKSNCPVTNSSTAAQYANGCWVANAGSSGIGTFNATDCASITEGTTTVSTQPADSPDKVTPFALSTVKAPYICGNDGVRGNASTESENENEVHVAFNFGCVGDEYDGALNPIVDVAFAIFRFLSAGVGLIVIGSVIVAGIQYTTSRGNPQATQAAIKRMTSAVIGLIIFMFIFSIANFLIPGGMFIS